MADLKPCPFCGGMAAFVPRAVNLALQKDPSDPKFGVSVICGRCGSESPNVIDEARAAEFWNRRAPSSPSIEREVSGEASADGVLACDGAQPVAWLHEFTDPHDGTRRRAAWMNLPRDYDLQPSDTVTPLYTAAGVDVGSQDQQGRVAQVIADFADLPWGDCRELSRRIAGVPVLGEPQQPAGMEPNYCNAEHCTCRMGFGYVACDQQPKWKPVSKSMLKRVAHAPAPGVALGDGAEQRVEAFAARRLAEIRGCELGCGAVGQCKANAHGNPSECPARGVTPTGGTDGR